MMVLDSLYRNGGGQMGFTRTRAADKNKILSFFHKFTVMQCSNQFFVYLTLDKIKACQLTMSWEACQLHLILNRTHFSFSDFGFESLLQYGFCFAVSR